MSDAVRSDRVVTKGGAPSQPTPPKPRTRTQRRTRETRRRLMASALGLFSERGVDATTIEDITERSDLGKGTFYRHFHDKQDLLSHLTVAAVASLVDALRAAPAQAAGGSLEGVLDRLLKVHSTFFTTHEKEFLLLFQGRLFLTMDREEAEELEGPYVGYLRAIEEQIRPFLPEGVSSLKIRRLTCALAGYVSGFLSFGMVGLTPQELEMSFEPLRRAFVAGSSAFLHEKASADVPAPRAKSAGEPTPPKPAEEKS
jgi:AcrR family transcriptional regulator